MIGGDAYFGRIVDRLMLDPGTGFSPAHWDWSERYRYQKAIYRGLGRMPVGQLVAS